MECCLESDEEILAEEVFTKEEIEDGEDGVNGDNDEEPSSSGPTDEKRRRRVSDIIDSASGDREAVANEGFKTPRRRHSTKDSDVVSPDQGYSATPESVNVFSPDWLVNKPIDFVDAAPNNFPDDETSRTPTGITASMPVEMDSDRYNMNHKYRGKCVVFNHEYFDMGFDPREGSSVDAKRISETFETLGFKVEILDNLEHAEVVDKITKLSEENHEEADCICIFMLTHGMRNDMICAKDVAYNVDKIWKPFTADNCRSLAGKPKLFFLQACRGEELDDGVTLRRSVTRRTETDSVVTSYTIPTHADFLIAHSSAQGYYSWRNPTEGTWFIQSLCDVFKEYAETTDLLKMLTITARKIATERASYHDIDPFLHNKKQVPSVTSMLLRDIYFTSK